MGSNSILGHVLQAIVEKRDLCPNDKDMFSELSTLVRGSTSRFAMVIEMFDKLLYQSIMANGSRTVSFLLRNQRLIDGWQRVWSFVQGDMLVFSYGGTDSMEEYVLTLVLQSSSDLLLSNSLPITSLAQSIGISSAASFHQSSSHDLGVYGFVEEGNNSTLYHDGGNESEHQESNFDELVDVASLECDILPALQRRYEAQAAFIVINRSDHQNCVSEDPEAANVINGIIQELASIHSDQNGRETVIPSPEFLSVLFMIDRSAMAHGNANGIGLTREQLPQLLNEDVELAKNVHTLLKVVIPEITYQNAALFIRFIVVSSERSIWKMTNGRYNNRNDSAVTFRTEVRFS